MKDSARKLVRVGPGIYKRDGKYVAVVELPRENGKRRMQWSAGHVERKDADEARYAIMGSRSKNISSEGRKLTLGEYAQRWLALTKPAVAHNTYTRYEAIVRLHITPKLGTHTLAKLRSDHIAKALSAWQTGPRADNKKSKAKLSARSVDHILLTLSMILGHAHKNDLVHKNAAQGVKRPAAEHRESLVPDEVGLSALLGILADKSGSPAERSLETPVLVAIGTGMRAGEVLGLQWGDVDFAAGTVRVARSLECAAGVLRFKAPKTKRSRRTLSMSPQVAEALAAHRLTQGLLSRNPQAVVFPDPVKGGPWRPVSFSGAFARLCKSPRARSAGVPKMRFHDLRHFYATSQLASGIDLKTISTSLGHSAIGMTANLYAHASDSLGRAAADRHGETLARILSGRKTG